MAINLRHTPLVKALLWIAVVTWSIILYLSECYSIWSAVPKVSGAVSVSYLLYFIFSKWLWRMSIFQGWLVPLPDLSGTWKADLTSNFEGKTVVIAETKIMHSFTNLVVRQNTIEANSDSDSTSYVYINGVEIPDIVVTYKTNTKQGVKPRSENGHGTMRLRYNSDEDTLTGSYWTDRGTAGEIELTRRYF